MKKKLYVFEAWGNYSMYTFGVVDYNKLDAEEECHVPNLGGIDLISEVPVYADTPLGVLFETSYIEQFINP